MQWLVQNSGVTFVCLDNNIAPLVEAIDKRGDPRFAIGVIPFTDTIVGMDEIDVSVPTMFYGSTRLVEIAETLPIKPGVFFTHSWFDPKNWVGKRDDLLNESQINLTVGELREHWINESFFVKSVDPKVLTGMVLEGYSDKDWWIKEYEHLNDESKIVVSPIQEIEQEWRFFIVNGEVVTGSQYKHDGILRIREPIIDAVWNQARYMSSGWMPSPNIVMDIALMKDKTFKVIEFI